MVQIRNENELGLAMRQRRNELAWDQATLAEKAGVSRQWVIEIENGKSGAELGLVLRALRTLGLQVDLATPSQIASKGPVGADLARAVLERKTRSAKPESAP